MSETKITMTKEQLFKAIDTGKYKDYTMPESAKSLAPKYRAVEGLSERDTNDVVRDMTARFFAKVFGTNKSLYEISNLTAPELFDAIKAEYEEENKIIGENSWLALVNKTKDFLRTFKIEFNKDDILDAYNYSTKEPLNFLMVDTRGEGLKRLRKNFTDFIKKK